MKTLNDLVFASGDISTHWFRDSSQGAESSYDF